MGTSGQNLNGMKVLVVDDDAATVALLRATLEIYGAQVCGALSGQEALAQCERQVPQVILLDLLMPTMDGWALLAELRHRYPQLPPPYVVAVSAAEFYDEEVQGELSAFHGFIKKPFSPRQVIAQLQQFNLTAAC
jgi:CheY-like chemotaxis protein